MRSTTSTRFGFAVAVGGALVAAAVGCAVGCVNLGSAFFLIRALDTLPATVVFPAMCGGVVALIALLGRVFFREQLGKRGWTAIALTVVSLVLINL